MKFSWCTLNVKDLKKSIEFFNIIVGLEITRQIKAGPETEIVFMGHGETQIELIETKGIEPKHSQDISLGFEVDSLNQHMDWIKGKGFSIHSGPFQPNPGISFFYVLDPNGIKIQFLEKHHSD